jgi:hypothetical protein
VSAAAVSSLMRRAVIHQGIVTIAVEWRQRSVPVDKPAIVGERHPYLFMYVTLSRAFAHALSVPLPPVTVYLTYPMVHTLLLVPLHCLTALNVKSNIGDSTS